MNNPILKDISVEGCDIRLLTDELRKEYAIVKNNSNEWILLKHADVGAAALDSKTYSSNVSRFLQIPNGLDGKVHSNYRKVIERYLSPEALTPFIPLFEQVAKQIIADLPKHKVIDAVNDIGAIFAVRAQCKWLGWPSELEPRILHWMKENHAATRSGDIKRTKKVAEEFDDIIRSIIKPIKAQDKTLENTVTNQLCREIVNGKLLTECEIISILRNWTGGDLGSIALCVGVLISYIAKNPNIAEQIRHASDNEVVAIIDEIIRIDNPFVSNRRITTCPVKIAGQTLPTGAKIQLNWTSANRDEAVFKNNKFDPIGNADKNLVYGIGKHVCPGRLLASWELRIAIQTLLKSVESINLVVKQPPEREKAPVGGFCSVPIIIK